jgi:hypothetical protein
MSRIVSSLVALTLVWVSVGTVKAQTADEALVPAPTTGKPVEETSLQSCFDYYRFGSVPVVLSTETVRLAQGSDLRITGKVINQNDYSVDDITVYGKVYYKKNFDKSSYGPDIIEMMPLVEDISLMPGEEKTFTYTWPIPSKLEPGNYQIASFVVSHDRFNMAGLSFTSDVVGNLLNFSVVGENLGSVRFDNTKTILNDVPFHGAIFPPKSDSPVDGVPLTATITNTSARAVSGKVNWKVYSWDNMRSENLISESSTPFTLGATSSSTVNLRITDSAHSVYYVVGELIPDGAKTSTSILQVRYVQTGDEAPTLPRIGFLGVTNYPAEKDKTKAFVCVHSSGARAVKGGKVVLSVVPLDPIDKLLNPAGFGKTTFSGDIPGAMSAVSLPFAMGSNNFAVTVDLYQDDKIIDSVTRTYACVPSETDDCKTISTMQIVAGAAGGLVVLIGLAWFIWRLIRKRRSIVNITATEPQ